MEKHEKMARELFKQGKDCSTSLHTSFSKDTELSKDYPAPRSVEGKCGALLTAENILKQKGCQDKIQEFEKEFIKLFKYTKCSDLMKFERRCNDYVGESANLVDKYLTEKQ